MARSAVLSTNAGPGSTIRVVAGHRHGITNAQARFLARLCRELGKPYPGHGMTLLEASDAIDQAKAELAAARERRRAPAPPAAR